MREHVYSFHGRYIIKCNIYRSKGDASRSLRYVIVEDIIKLYVYPSFELDIYIRMISKSRV